MIAQPCPAEVGLARDVVREMLELWPTSSFSDGLPPEDRAFLETGRGPGDSRPPSQVFEQFIGG